MFVEGKCTQCSKMIPNCQFCDKGKCTGCECEYSLVGEGGRGRLMAAADDKRLGRGRGGVVVVVAGKGHLPHSYATRHARRCTPGERPATYKMRCHGS